MVCGPGLAGSTDAVAMFRDELSEVFMPTANESPALFPGLLVGTYDCVDRLLRACFTFAQSPGGFRVWCRRWQGSERSWSTRTSGQHAGPCRPLAGGKLA